VACKTGGDVKLAAAVRRAKWNAYTEDQLLHNGQGQGNGQYWEQYLKQVGDRHAVQQHITGRSAVSKGFRTLMEWLTLQIASALSVS
jgi:hypothetical protein